MQMRNPREKQSEAIQGAFGDEPSVVVDCGAGPAALDPPRFRPRKTRTGVRGPNLGRPVKNQGQRIAIEGPLRVGKSTLAGYLAERLRSKTVCESVANPFLARFYAGEPGMAFATQMWFLRERTAQLQAADRLSGDVVADYLLEKDKLFAHLTLSDAELAIYRKYYDAHMAEKAGIFRPDLVVYLRADLEVLKERRRRRRQEQKREMGPGLLRDLRVVRRDSRSHRIGQEYAEQVSEAYDHFFARYTGSRLLVVDTSAIDFVNNPRERELLLDRIVAPVHGREHFMPMGAIA